MGFFSVDTPIAVKNFNFQSAKFTLTMRSATVDPQDAQKILVSIDVRNDMEEVLDAYMVGFEFFSVFNEHSGHRGGYSLGDIKPGKTVTAKWSFLVFEPGLIGTVVAYPFKSRSKSGSVWIYDGTVIEDKIKELFQAEISIKTEENKRRKH